MPKLVAAGCSFILIKEHLTHKGLYDTYRASNYKT